MSEGGSMARRFLGTIAAIAMIAAVAPERADAQEAGWWEWALKEVVESRDAPAGRDRDRTAEGRRTVTLGDVILGRDTDGRREREKDRARRSRDDDSRASSRADGDRKGPAFCRSGAGHPVHGRQWCRDKGFGLGSGSAIRWEDRGWEDVILRAPRDRERRSGTVDRGGLIDILGDVVYGRLLNENRRVGGSDPLTGRWLNPGGVADVLQIRSGGVAVAELSDLDGDGRVDAVLVPRR